MSDQDRRSHEHNARATLKIRDSSQQKRSRCVCLLLACQPYRFDLAKLWNDVQLAAYVKVDTNPAWAGQLPPELGWHTDGRVDRVILIHGGVLKTDGIVIWLGVEDHSDYEGAGTRVSLNDQGQIVCEHPLRVVQLTILHRDFVYDWISEVARNAYGEERTGAESGDK